MGNKKPYMFMSEEEKREVEDKLLWQIIIPATVSLLTAVIAKWLLYGK